MHTCVFNFSPSPWEMNEYLQVKTQHIHPSDCNNAPELRWTITSLCYCWQIADGNLKASSVRENSTSSEWHMGLSKRPFSSHSVSCTRAPTLDSDPEALPTPEMLRVCFFWNSSVPGIHKRQKEQWCVYNSLKPIRVPHREKEGDYHKTNWQPFILFTQMFGLLGKCVSKAP